MLRNHRAMVLAAVAAVAVGAAKYAVHAAGLEFIELSSLVTALIGGCIFLFGMMLAGTLSDYKEADRLPAEYVAALDSIREDVEHVARTWPAFDAAGARAKVRAAATGFVDAVNAREFDGALDEIAALTPMLHAMETAGYPATFVSRLKNDQTTLRRLVLRVAHIERTDFLPSAFRLLVAVVVCVLAILVFTVIELPLVAVILVGFVAFLFSYVLVLLRVMERPFQPQGATRDDVSLHLIEDFVARMDRAGA